MSFSSPSMSPQAGSFKKTPSMLAKVFAKTEITQAEEALAESTRLSDENAKLAEELKQAKKENTELEEANKQKDTLIREQEMLIQELREIMKKNKDDTASVKELEQQYQQAQEKCQELMIERDEAVCALTRAMMVPELKGEEYEALLSVLPEEQD